METTQLPGVAIAPVVYPLNEGTATRMTVLVLGFPTNALTATTYFELLTDEGKVMRRENYTMTEEEFAQWGTDNSYVNKCVANAIGVTILNEAVAE